MLTTKAFLYKYNKLYVYKFNIKEPTHVHVLC